MNKLKKLDPSMYSSLKNTVGSIEELIKKVKNINHQDGDDDTLLHAAVKAVFLDVVDLLLSQSNIDINIINNQGKTPLDLANDLDVNIHSNKQNIINQLNQAQPGPSRLGQQVVQPASS